MIENAPSLFAVAVPKEEEPLNRVTVEPASAVPVIVGVESLAAEEVDNDVGALGAVVSIINALFAPREPDAPGVAKVRVASLPAASFIVPPFNTSAEVLVKSRSLEVSPDWTV
mgnify:CR=1 FL=1